jgi:signal recognition particle receptor subunit beta
MFKLVVAGPYAAGKTTLIQSVSDRPVVGTEAATSGSEALVKATTTVGMEFGSYTVSDDDVVVELSLFGVPGQERFSFMWDIVSQGMDGLCYLVDGTAPDTWSEAGVALRRFGELSDAPTLLAVNRAVGRPGLVESVCESLPVTPDGTIACDVTDRASARGVVVELLLLVLDHLPDEVAS